MVGHGFPSPSAAEMLPPLLNPLFLTLRTPLTGEDCRWGYVWLLMEEQYVAMVITEKLNTCCHNHLHATCRANQLPECSFPQPIRTCHVLVHTHNSWSMCYLLLCNSFKIICVISSISSLQNLLLWKFVPVCLFSYWMPQLLVIFIKQDIAI
jgi:hypothetical protein